MKKGLVIMASTLSLFTLTGCRAKAPTSINILGTPVALGNKKYKFYADCLGEGVNKQVIWETDNPQVAYIDQNGLLTTEIVNEITPIKITCTSAVSKSTVGVFDLTLLDIKGESKEDFMTTFKKNEITLTKKYEGHVPIQISATFDEENDFAVFGKERCKIIGANYRFLQSVELGHEDDIRQCIEYKAKGRWTFSRTTELYNARILGIKFDQVEAGKLKGLDCDYSFFEHVDEDGNHYKGYYFYIVGSLSTEMEYAVFDQDGYLDSLLRGDEKGPSLYLHTSRAE